MMRPFGGFTFGPSICIPQGAPDVGWSFVRNTQQRRNLLDPTQKPVVAFTRASDAVLFPGDGSMTQFASNVPVFGERGLLILGDTPNLIRYSEDFAHPYWEATAAVSLSETPSLRDMEERTYLLRDTSKSQTREILQIITSSTGFGSAPSLDLSGYADNELWKGFLICKKVPEDPDSPDYLCAVELAATQEDGADFLENTCIVTFNPRTGEIVKSANRLRAFVAGTVYTLEDDAEGTSQYGAAMDLGNGFYAIPFGLAERGMDTGVSGSPVVAPLPLTDLRLVIYPAYTSDPDATLPDASVTGSLDIFAAMVGFPASVNSYIRSDEDVETRALDSATASMPSVSADASLYARSSRDPYALEDSVTFVGGVQQANGVTMAVRDDYDFTTYKADAIIAALEELELATIDRSDYTARIFLESDPFVSSGVGLNFNSHNIAGAYSTGNAVQFSVDGFVAQTQDETFPGPYTFFDLQIGNREGSINSAFCLDGYVQALFVYQRALTPAELVDSSGSCRG